MTVKELEEAYQQLHQQLLRGELEEDEFKSQVERLRFEDALGRQWKIGWYTGQWYRYDEGLWVLDEPREDAIPSAAEADEKALYEESGRKHSAAIWLAVLLIALVCLAAAALLSSWGADWWAGQQAQIAATTATAEAVALQPSATPLPPEPTPTPTTTALPTATPTQRPQPTPTTPAPRPTKTATELPTPTPTPATTITASTATPALGGRILFPLYDPEPDRRTFDIWAVDLRSGERQLIAKQASQPALSPNARRLAYRSWNSAQQGLLVQEQPDGHTWVWVNYAEAARPNWSPDNQNIVFPSQQESDRQWRVYRTWGPESDRIRRHGGDIMGRVPVWLSDGRIVYWECPLNKCGLYAMREDGTNPIRLTTGEHDTAPAASPDGKQIAFMSNRDGNWEVYVVSTHPPAGQTEAGLERLTHHQARDGIPVWSPDGRWVAFASDRGGSWAIWIVHPDGSGQRKLFDLEGSLEGQVTGVPPDIEHDWTWETLAWAP